MEHPTPPARFVPTEASPFQEGGLTGSGVSDIPRSVGTLPTREGYFINKFIFQYINK